MDVLEPSEYARKLADDNRRLALRCRCINWVTCLYSARYSSKRFHQFSFPLARRIFTDDHEIVPVRITRGAFGFGSVWSISNVEAILFVIRFSNATPAGARMCIVAILPVMLNSVTRSLHAPGGDQYGECPHLQQTLGAQEPANSRLDLSCPESSSVAPEKTTCQY